MRQLESHHKRDKGSKKKCNRQDPLQDFHECVSTCTPVAVLETIVYSDVFDLKAHKHRCISKANIGTYFRGSSISRFSRVFKKREIKGPRIKILANAFNTHIENPNHKKIIFRN